MEEEIPVVCLCEEMLSSIGAQYGDKILVEAKYKTVKVRCVRLNQLMKEFHDFVLNPPDDADDLENMSCKFDNKRWLKSPFNLATNNRSDKTTPDLIHPIFMDSISRDLLNVKSNDPIKVQRSFRWEMMKKLNSVVGASALVIIALILSQMFSEENKDLTLLYWIMLIPPLVAFMWSIITYSKYTIPGSH